MANSKMGRGSNWSLEQNRVLLVIWPRAGVFWRQRPRRQGKVYNGISAELASRPKGYDRNAAQIKNKIKEMKKGYKECKDHNSKSGNDRKVIDYYDDLDAILGLRPSVFPSVNDECDYGVYAWLWPSIVWWYWEWHICWQRFCARSWFWLWRSAIGGVSSEEEEEVIERSGRGLVVRVFDSAGL